MPVAFEGGCFCGEIRYRAKSVFDSGYCHCSMCRRFTGCPALTWFSVPEHDFSLVSGVPKAFQSSATFTRYFCSTCGTHVFGRDSRTASPKVGFRLVSIGIGTLDDPETDRVKSVTVRVTPERKWIARLGPFAAWAWTILAAGGGAMLLIDKGPWPLTNGWFALLSGAAACPLTAWCAKRWFGIRLSGRAQFVAAVVIWLAGQIARRIGL